MSTIVQEIPQLIVTHLEDVADKFGLDVSQENMDKLKQGWLEKQQMFQEKTLEMGMKEEESLGVEDERAALLLTYSGSLISLGTAKNLNRNAEYTSIGLRKDVPESLTLEEVQLAEDARKGDPLSFKDGPLKQTSRLYRIMVCPEEMPATEQEEMLQEATTMIVDTFIGVNQDLFD